MIQVDILIAIMVTILFVISVSINLVLYHYAKNKIGSFLTASEEASQIFTLLDAYREHLESVFSLPTFYGDETLKSLLDHTRELYKFFSLYEEIYSLTQPDLLEQLEEASKEMEKNNEDKTNKEG
jgi:hypothetical protein